MERRYLSTNRGMAHDAFLNSTLQKPLVNLTMISQNSKKSLDQYSQNFSEEFALQQKPPLALQDPTLTYQTIGSPKHEQRKKAQILKLAHTTSNPGSPVH